MKKYGHIPNFIEIAQKVWALILYLGDFKTDISGGGEINLHNFLTVNFLCSTFI